MNEELVLCLLCHVERPVRDFPNLKNATLYARCKPCLRKFPVEVIFLRDRGMCGICHERVTDFRHASNDHIIPVSAWDWNTKPDGPHIGENLQLAHVSCNLKKGNIVIGEDNHAHA